MKFDAPAQTNPIDRMKIVGKPVDRIDGPLKTTGTAPYAYERHDVATDQAYGYILGAAIAKGRINRMDLDAALQASGVLGIVTARNAGPLGIGIFNTAKLLGGPDIEHYHQAVAIVVAETFEQARAATALIRVDYDRQDGSYDLASVKDKAVKPSREQPDSAVGDFAQGFAAAPVKFDQTYTTPDHSHAMMEPFASIAAWRGDELTVWTSNQMIAWARGDIARTLGIPPEKVRVESPFIGGGFGGKLWVRADVVLAALAAREVKRPVKVAMQRALMPNNSTHRPATIQRVRLGMSRDGHILALGHESWSGNLAGGPSGKLEDSQYEQATQQSQVMYAGADRLTRSRLAPLDLPEGSAMRAPGEAPGLMVFEIAMDEVAERLGMDPVRFRVLNDTQVDPNNPKRPFSRREFVRCLETGADQFGWERRQATPGTMRDGEWLIGMGMAAGIRANHLLKSGARARLGRDGRITIETDMTDIGTGSYTIIAQTAAEMMGVSLDRVVVRLGSSNFPVSAGSGGQFGANCSTSGVYAACVKLREAVGQKLGFNEAEAEFVDGRVRVDRRTILLADAARDGEIVVEDTIEFAGLRDKFLQQTFVAHFVELAVNAFTGETRVRRMLAVCAAGRILNPKTARSQVIGAMTMGLGAALMEELAIDKRFGFFVNHDLAGYEVPVHMDIPHQEVIFLDEQDPVSSPMKAKGVGELGLCGVGAAVANAVYNATGVRVRDYPIRLDKLIDRLPASTIA